MCGRNKEKQSSFESSLNDFLTNTGSKGNGEIHACIVNSGIMEYAYDVRCVLSDTEHHRR